MIKYKVTQSIALKNLCVVLSRKLKLMDGHDMQSCYFMFLFIFSKQTQMVIKK